MLTIAKKSYVFQGIRDGNFDKALGHIKHGVQAFELAKQEKTVSKLIEAYEALPSNEKSLSISADIIESLLELKAYHDAINIAEKLERKVAMNDTGSKTEHFNILRVYSNLAEAHSEAQHFAMARRYYHKALDHIFESTQEPDLDMINLLLSRIDGMH